jgi:hypothetical protein
MAMDTHYFHKVADDLAERRDYHIHWLGLRVAAFEDTAALRSLDSSGLVITAAFSQEVEQHTAIEVSESLFASMAEQVESV